VPEVVTGGIVPFQQLDRTKTSRELRGEAEVLHRQVLDLSGDTASLRRSSMVHELDAVAEEASRESPEVLLNRLAEAGMAWRDVARLVGVTVPAVQKWRRGGSITGANRLKLARIVGLLDVLKRNFVAEGVSWLEMPVKQGVCLSRLDLFANGSEDLVLELISDDGNEKAVDGILDRFNPRWRTTLVDDAFEAFVGGDGNMSVRPRR